MMQKPSIQQLQLGASISLIALILLCLAWETILAPFKPGGSLLMLKTLPLLLPLFGILHGKRYTYKWASMFILLYFTEGVVRARLALLEVLLTVIFFGCAIYFAKFTRAK